MKRQTILLLSLIMLPMAGCLAPSGLGEETVAFTGTVKAVEVLGKREAAVYPVGVDPRWLLALHVDSVERNASSPIAAGKDVIFAIHSPSRLLGTDEPVGRAFGFTATWQFGPDEKKFTRLEAVRSESAIHGGKEKARENP